MRKVYYLPFSFLLLIFLSALFSCGEIAPIHEVRLLDSLNRHAYQYRYKNLDTTLCASQLAYEQAKLYKQGKAEACNNLGFYYFMRMDFEKAVGYHKEVFGLTSNELECLIADIGLMKVYQRTSMNKEYYDYRNSAINRMKRINEDISVFTDAHEKLRVNYAMSEFRIVSAIYCYYLQQHPEAIHEINQIKEDEKLAADTAQWLYYHYIKGSAGLCTDEDLEEAIVCQFDNLYRCWRNSTENSYIYFEANCLQGLAELLNNRMASEVLHDRRSQAIRMINLRQYPDSLLPLQLAKGALAGFKTYDDIYQIAGAYRTIGTWLNEYGHYAEAVDSLTNALAFVNLHHARYYHCGDGQHRLKTFAPDDTVIVDLAWLNDEQIMTVPEWIARIREQLSVAYSGLDNKPASDYNRNIYLDILEYTRQDKELESRYQALEQESKELNILIGIVVVGVILLIPLFWILNARWERRNREDVVRLRKTLDICQKITASIPVDAVSADTIVRSIISSISLDLSELFRFHSMQIILNDEEQEEEGYVPISEEEAEEATGEEPAGVLFELPLHTPDSERPIGMIQLYTPRKLTRDEQAVMKVIAPYITWAISNGLAFISLGEERRRLEKELYVYEQHIIENKRQNLIKRACMAIVVGLNPFIDRIINEISKLKNKEYTREEQVKRDKFQYIDDLITRINEYNDILALWIKMKQGTLSLNIENFALNDLFEVIIKGRKTFEMKQQSFGVDPTTAVVKADKALTLFMINTLIENARKYTAPGGSVSVYAGEGEDYVEISVKDTGRGLTREDISLILDEKVYDSNQIGVRSAGDDLEELKTNKGSGFGLMNCKGIIEKYKKTSELFRVCLFGVESEPGKGSRFYFRLPKGVRKAMGVLLCLLSSTAWFACATHLQDQVRDVPADGAYYQLLTEASCLADSAYYCNVELDYEGALYYIELALSRLNEHYLQFAHQPGQPMTLVGMGTAAEVGWWNELFESDYHIILDIRNEASVAFLALKNLDAYRYNNKAYTNLFKLLGEDVSLAEYCRRLEHSTNNKIVGIILCFALLLVFLISYYFLYIRRQFANRRNLEQVLEINKETFSASLVRTSDSDEELAIPARIVDEIYDAVNELLIIDLLGIAVYNEDTSKLGFVFNPRQDERANELEEMMKRSFDTESHQASDDATYQCFPLLVDIGGTHRCVGVLAFIKQVRSGYESDQLLSELIARFVAIVIYNAVLRLATKYRDIETARDETRRALREDNLIHVQNMVLDNCLSTIKHETIYYPNKIKLIIDKLNSSVLTGEEEQEHIATISELISYYKDIYTILSSCASRQLDEVTFKRSTIHVPLLLDYARKYFAKVTRRIDHRLEMEIDSGELYVTGDFILLRFLLESLIDEAISYPADGSLVLSVKEEGDFVRFLFTDRRREKSTDELNQLFYPNLARMENAQAGNRLTGTEYLICKQIIRDHDEYAGRRGCRINAEPDREGGFGVYFTVPSRKMRN